MNKLRTYIMYFLAVLIMAVILVGGMLYIFNVQESLWQMSISDLKEITIQGGHAFEVYLRNDLQSVHGLSISLSRHDSGDVEYIKSRLEAYGDDNDSSFYTVIDMDQEVFYSLITENLRNPVPPARMDTYKTLPPGGVEEPYISEVNGLKNLGCYEFFTFADGVPGMIRRSKPLNLVAEEFSLSSYDGEGFSYIVNRQGDILIRSEHTDSNLSFQNIFDVMTLEGADSGSNRETADAFRTAMEEGRGGVLRFLAGDGEKYVYAYFPLSGTDGWYYVSVVPNSVIMEQGSRILSLSYFFFLIIGACCLVGIVVAFLIYQNRRAIAKVVVETQYREQIFDILTSDTGEVFVMFTASDRQVEYVSPNVGAALGIPVDAIVEDVSILREPGADHDAFEEGLSRLEPGGSFSFEQERIHRITGERRWFATTVYRVAVQSVDKVVMVFSDCTVEKQKEQALEEAVNIARAANQSKSTFLSNMSHDIRTPMNAIVGLCTLLQRDADNPERVRAHTRKITSSSQHLLGLINDVLDMSKIESGKTTLNISEFNLAELVQELDTILHPQVKAKEQTFHISVFDIKSEHLLGDELRINQILINILSNAVKYTPRGGRVEMEIRELPQTVKNFARLRFVVSDNGIGMSPEYQETIFQPFTREIRTTTNKIQGTGLGMAITKSLIDLMGGTITVESAPGTGSTFTVDLELRIQKQDVDQDFWRTHGLTNALVVDDEAEICASIVSAMEGTGVSMQFALSGASAIRTVEQAHGDGRDFDLVLLDWKMPEMDGIETARHIRKILPHDTPILILTAYDWSDIEDEALEAGIDGFLPKPFFFTNFKLTIERLQKNEEARAKEESSVLDGLHILAAEDNELNSEILQELLDMMGATCEIMENGEKALERFSQSQPEEYDLILMDVQMPVMNGYEATRAIRACDHPRAGTIPIIAMTADAFVEDIQRAMEAGMNEHVSKPIDLKRLEYTVREVQKGMPRSGSF